MPLPLLDHQCQGYRGVARDITHQRLQQERIARLSRHSGGAQRHQLDHWFASTKRRELPARVLAESPYNKAVSMAWIGLVEPAPMKADPLVWEGFEEGICRRSA